MVRFFRRVAFLLVGLLAVGLAGLAITALLIRFEHAILPGEGALLNPVRLPPEGAFDVMGRSVTAAEAATLSGTPEGRTLLSPASGAIRIDDALIGTGRDIFYRETFGNEVFFSDILGVLDGGLTPGRAFLAIADLAGRGTSNLRVALSSDVQVGDRLGKAGELVPTGLDVPRGAVLPLGIRTFYDRGRVRVGLTCALCHSTVDPGTGKVLEGAPNTDLNLGLLLALSSNPAALFSQTGIGSLQAHRTRPERFVRRSSAGTDLLPDPDTLAAAVRRSLAAWPPGSVDTTADLNGNPTSIPSVFTRDAFPFGWSGQAQLGPFRGLSSVSDTIHGLAGDATALAPAADALFGLDPEVFLGTLLQSAPDSGFHFDVGAGGGKPSDVFAPADPTQGIPGVARLVMLPGFMRANYVTAIGLIPVRHGEPIATATAALSAFQNTLRPPAAPVAASDRPAIERGRQVFDRAGCTACHSGPTFTSHRVWPASVIGTEPSRAGAFARREAGVARPQVFAPDTPFPPPIDAQLLPVPIPNEGQLKLAWGFNATGGGYKVPSLVGLRWTAPFLHDGGVAAPAAPDGPAGAFSVAGRADPANSLRALVDRTWRNRVMAANGTAPEARSVRVTGEGHTFWVDSEAGFRDEERDALITFLLSIDGPEPAATPAGR